MKRRTIQIALAAALLLGGCTATTAPPLRYAAVQMPSGVPANLPPPSRVELEVERRNWGGMYRGAQDAAAVLDQLQNKAGTPILRNADLRLQTPPCYLVVCIGHDLATAGSPAAP